MVWTCRAQHRLDCRSTQAECGCTEKIWQDKEIMGWSAGEWQKEARYGFCWPSEPFWVERTPSRKTCQKAQPSVEENRALKWIWWWWWWSFQFLLTCCFPCDFFFKFQLSKLKLVFILLSTPSVFFQLHFYFANYLSEINYRRLPLCWLRVSRYYHLCRSDFSFPTFFLYISLHFNSVYVENG